MRTVVYPGLGLSVHLGEEGKLSATSRGFEKFVHARLLHLWKLSGGKAKCRTAPTVTVESWRADGYARAGEGIYAPCPGGGYDQIYIKTDGAWTAPRCARQPGGALVLAAALVRDPAPGGRPHLLLRLR